MRFFRLFDELSSEGGDLYKWEDGVVRMQLPSGEYSDHFDIPAPGETIEDLMGALAGPNGRFEEINEPA